MTVITLAAVRWASEPISVVGRVTSVVAPILVVVVLIVVVFVAAVLVLTGIEEGSNIDVGRDKDAIDDMDHAICNLKIGSNDSRVVNEDIAIIRETDLDSAP